MKKYFATKSSNRLWGMSFWLVCTITFVISRMATWLYPYDSDHWIFAYIGRIWATGGTLYVDAWDHKSPLIFAFNGFIYKLFGDDIVLARITFTIIAVVTIWLFYKTVCLLLKQTSLGDSTKYAKISTVIFIILANTSQFASSGNNNENLGVALLLGTVYLYLRYRQSNNMRLLIGAGFLAGFVFMLKVNFSILLLPLVLDIIYQQWPKIILAIRNLLLFSIGIFAQLIFWLVYFYQTGTLNDFITAAYLYNSKYIRALGWDPSEPGLLIFLGTVALLVALYAPFAIKSILWTIKNKSDRRSQLIVSLMSLSVVLFILTAGTYYSYYFLITMPFICLVLATTWPQLQEKFGKKLIVFVSIILLIFVVISYRQLYNNFSGAAAIDAANMNEAADYIKTHSSPNDTIFANMYGATFYQLAERNSASRYISASYLLVDYKFNFGYDLNGVAIAEFEKSKPKYIIIGSDQNDLYMTKNQPMSQYINSHYSLEKTLTGYKILVRNNQ